MDIFLLKKKHNKIIKMNIKLHFAKELRIRQANVYQVLGS
jgi:hypothetical protein